jgi:hypothetical protein
MACHRFWLGEFVDLAVCYSLSVTLIERFRRSACALRSVDQGSNEIPDSLWQSVLLGQFANPPNDCASDDNGVSPGSHPARLVRS